MLQLMKLGQIFKECIHRTYPQNVSTEQPRQAHRLSASYFWFKKRSPKAWLSTWNALKHLLKLLPQKVREKCSPCPDNSVKQKKKF